MKLERRIVAALFLAYAVYAVLIFNRADRLVHDDGFVTTLAHLINNGHLPYRDFFLVVTPGTFFVQALLQRLFGDEFIVGRLYVLLEHLALAGILWRVSALTIPTGAGRILPMALLFFGPLFSHPFYSLDALLLASLMLWASVRYVGGGAAWNLYAASVLAALTTLFKQNIGLASMVFVAGIAWWAQRADHRIARPSAVACGLAAPLTAFGIYLVLSDSVSAFADNVFRATSSLKMPLVPGQLGAFVIPNRFGLPLIAGTICLAAGWRLPWRWRTVLWSLPAVALGGAIAAADARDQHTRRLISWVQAGVADAVMLIPTTMCLAALWLLVNRPSSSRREPPWLALLTWFSFLHLIGAAMAGATWYHLSMAFPFVYVLSGRVYADATDATTMAPAARVVAGGASLRRGLPVAAGALIAYGVSVNLFIAAFGERVDSSWNRNPLTALARMVDPARPGLRGLRLAPEYAAELGTIADFVRAETPPQEEIFAFPMGMPIYVATQRFSTSYYSHFYPEAAAPPDWNSRTIQYLEAARPRVVVLSDMPGDASRARRDEVLSVDGRATELRNYLESRFTPVRNVGSHVILERREPLSQP